MFLLVSVRHVGAHPDELQHGVSNISIRMASRLSRIRIIPSTQILARVFVYLPPFISQILDLICRMVLNFILIYFGWRDTENQFSNFRANFDVHFMEQKFVNVASIFILKNIRLKGLCAGFHN